MNYKQFVNSRRIRADVEYADSNPNMDDSANMNHWKVILKRGNKRMTVPFSTGYALNQPDAADVISCLASDSASVRYARSFEDWASDLGYDIDSRKAERTFKVCEKQANKLESFLGGSDELETLLKCQDD